MDSVPNNVAEQRPAGVIFDWGRTLYDPTAGALFADATATVTTLVATYRLAIVSLVSGDYQARVADRYAVLRAQGIERHFAAILFGREDKDQLYRQALVTLGLPATRVAVVDDRLARGIAWGNRHGAMTIWFRNGKFRDELLDAATGAPTYTVSSLGEVCTVLRWAAGDAG